MFRVFLGAPTKREVDADPSLYHWQTVSSEDKHLSQSVILPSATLDAASRRISVIYQNIIFNDSLDEVDLTKGHEQDSAMVSKRDQTTMISWPPTEDTRGNILHRTVLSFLDDSSSSSDSRGDTQESISYNYSDASSIARFPTFHFSLHILTPFSSISPQPQKVNMLFAALEIEGPEMIRVKKGPDAGQEVSILKMILGDDEGNICKLTAWRETAETWGGSGDSTGVRRGDVILLENVLATSEVSTSPKLSASPYLKSKLTICYRTMPYMRSDIKLRPDLRLGESDPSVKKVAMLVRWFERIAGL